MRQLVEAAREAAAPPPAAGHAVARPDTLERRARAILDVDTRRAVPDAGTAALAALEDRIC